MNTTEAIEGILIEVRREMLQIVNDIAQKKMSLEGIVEQTQKFTNEMGCRFVEKMCALVWGCLL